MKIKKRELKQIEEIMQRRITQGNYDVLRENLHFLSNRLRLGSITLFTFNSELIETTSDNTHDIGIVSGLVLQKGVLNEKIGCWYKRTDGDLSYVRACKLSGCIFVIHQVHDSEYINRIFEKTQLFGLLDLSALIHFIHNGDNWKYFADYKRNMSDRERLVEELTELCSRKQNNSTLTLISIYDAKGIIEQKGNTYFNRLEDYLLSKVQQEFSTTIYRVGKGRFGFLSEQPIYTVYNIVLDIVGEAHIYPNFGIQSTISPVLESALQTLCLSEMRLEQTMQDEVVMLQHSDVLKNDIPREEQRTEVVKEIDFNQMFHSTYAERDSFQKPAYHLPISKI